MATFNYLALQKNREVHADSCGISWVHLGEKPNQNTFDAAKKRGVLIDHRSQQFQDSFFEEFDLILTVDEEISEQLKLRGPKFKEKIKLATDFSPKYRGQPIPDPYFSSEDGFDQMMDMVFDSCEGLLDSDCL